MEYKVVYKDYGYIINNDTFVSTQRLYSTENPLDVEITKNKVVAEGSPLAMFLLIHSGGHMTIQKAVACGLVKAISFNASDEDRVNNVGIDEVTYNSKGQKTMTNVDNKMIDGTKVENK